ncbi:ABC transporter ATP-binding protein [Neobacillus terrae]|uniref:ABC transporter ATP-binding protein n=1 Tax=Neobacillus terrae TaxID=3034837 RepID=UPI0014096C9D|nr:ABC transporter ATP-binding protein [Neobacillus terrae]NHM29293.1 ABC transporter ATP-binding protein [Neobacillus terrae]
MIKERISILMRQYFSLKDIKSIFYLIRPFILKQWKAYIILLVLLALDIYLTIAFASFYGRITDSAMHGGVKEILSLLHYGVALLFISIVSNFSYIYFDTIAINAVKVDLKNHLLHHILRIPADEASNLRTGELMSHFSNDIHGIDSMIGSSLISLIRLPIIYIVVFIYLANINLTLCLVSLIIAPIAGLSGILFGLLLRKNGREIHHLVGNIQNHLNESFQGINVIRSFTLEKMFYQKYKNKNQELFQLELENSKLRGWYYSGGQIISSMTFLVSLSVGALYVSKSVLSVGALFTFLNLVNHLVYPLTGLASQWAGFQRSVAAIERVMKVLNKQADVMELPSFLPGRAVEKYIKFEDLSFSYSENKNVFEHFNIEIPAGKVTAIVGPSGAGKSTLFHLLQGFYKPQAGEILLDGEPLDTFDTSTLRSSIAHVPQETFLFAGSVKDNLTIARPDITDKEMILAAQTAQLHEFIRSLPDGYETEIGERGIKLSGGQKQRLAIARAILKNAPILLLDEATSALDTETEHLVKEALDKLMKGRTTIIIAHRLSTIQSADQILVLDEGKIVQKGTHNELINSIGLYRNLYESSYKENKKQELSMAVSTH